MQTVNGFGGNAQRRVEAEAGVGERHVVVNGLGQIDDVEALFREAQRYRAQGTISGHTHLPGRKTLGRKGTQVETYNTCFIDGDPYFLAVDEKGRLDLVNWAQRRVEMGLDRAPPDSAR